MYHHIEGLVVALTPTRAVLETAGVGYELAIPFSTYQAIKGAERARLLVHFVVREDSQRLFGFATEPERDVFRVVVAISGVGPSTALAVLSTYRVEEFVQIVEVGNTAALQRIKGIGRKIADRLMVELRNLLPRLARTVPTAGGAAQADGVAPPPGTLASAVLAEATLALQELGFPRVEAEKRVHGALETLRGAGGGDGAVVEVGDTASPTITVESLLALALRPSG